MNRLLVVLISLLTGIATFGQDSLRTRYLEEVVVQSVKTETDTLQHFYRANRSANTEDILSRMQGVYLMRRSAYGQEPVIRGMSGGQINVTIDGMRMFSACTDKMDPVTIYVEPQNLKSIDAALGTNGASLGSTVGGSLDLTLAEPDIGKTGFGTSLGAGYQSVSNGLNYFADLDFGKEKSAYRANLIYRKNQNYRDGNGNPVAYSQFEKYNVAVSGKWQVGKDVVKADFIFDEGRNVGFPALPMDVGKANAKIYSLTYLRSRTAGLMSSVELKVYGNSVFHQMDDSQRPVEMHMDMPGWSDTYGMFAEGTARSLGKHHLSGRVDFYHNRMLAEMTMYPLVGKPMYMQTWPESNRSVGGFFAQDQIKFSTATSALINLRLDAALTNLTDGFGKDQLEVFYPEVTATTSNLLQTINATLSQKLNKQLIVQAHGGFSERLPTNAEWFGFYLFNRQDGYDYLGNPHLKVEKSWMGDGTVKLFTNGLELQATYFYQFIPDYVTAFVEGSVDAMTEGARGVKVYSNIPFARFQGFEFSGLAWLADGLQVVETLKGTFAETNEGDPLPFIPPVKNVTALRYQQKSVSLQAEWEAGTAQHRVSAAFGERSTPGYSIFNLRFGYKLNLFGNSIDLQAGVENLTGLYYREHLDWGGIPRPGRNMYCTLAYKF